LEEFKNVLALWRKLESKKFTPAVISEVCDILDGVSRTMCKWWLFVRRPAGLPKA
jgi:hypothetical protein